MVDKPIYSLGMIVSGHTLKHLTAGLACYWIVRMLKLRTSFDTSLPQRPISSTSAELETLA
jgi:hypothetical protein